MLDWDTQEKTEQPTATRREEARRKGQIPRSADLTVSLSLLAGCAALYQLGPWLLARGRDTFRLLLGRLSGPLDANALADLAAAGYSLLLITALPIAACTCGVIVASSVLQTRGSVRFEALGPDLGRLSPARAARRFFSLRSLARGVFSGLQLLAAGFLAAWVLAGVAGKLAGLSPADLGWAGEGGSTGPWRLWWGDVGSGGVKVALVLVVVGLLEYLFQRWQHERDLRMTRAELQEDVARQEGKSEYRSERRRARSRILNTTREVKPVGEDD